LVSLSLELYAALGSESSPYYQSEIPDALFLALLVLVLLLALLVLVLLLGGLLALLVLVLLLGGLLALPALLGVPQLSYHLFAVLVVVLANTLSGLLFHLAADDSVADDSVADDMGKYHFLAWAEVSRDIELVRDGYPQMVEYLSWYAELVGCPPG
jgi:hypothetical protein